MPNTDVKRKAVQDIVDAVRRNLTIIDINIGPSSTPEDHKEALEAAQKLDSLTALLTLELNGLASG